MFWVRHLGAGGVVYPRPGKTLLLTSGIEKEAQIFWVSFHGPSTPGMAVSSIHQHGVSSWQACQSSQVSMSLMEGSGRYLSLLSSGSGLTSGSQKVTLFSCWVLLEDLNCLSKDWLHWWLLLWLQGQDHWASLNPWLNLSISFYSTWAASSTLCWAALASQRASSLESPLPLGLDWDSLRASLASSSVVMGWTHWCRWFLREDRMC